MKKTYQKRLVFRILVLSFIALLYLFSPQSFFVLEGWQFFKHFSVLHLFWLLWVGEMVFQLVPLRTHFTMGSLKQFNLNYLLPKSGFDQAKLKQHRKHSYFIAAKAAAGWLVIVFIIGVLRYAAVLAERELLLLTAVFYVCDLICVLYWCPFQKWLMKNRCCITCRIFNWDSPMIFTPMAFIVSFFSLSLFLLSCIVFVLWEIRALKYPERFWEGANEALRCDQCKDKICGCNGGNKGEK